ncbi:MAG: hypothetical protein K2X82_05905 [Gemmataceae bacterium]|nr:hypothetical protein [Gemmataceae bacterium]
MTPPNRPPVPLGQTVATPAALGLLSHPDILAALRRHAAGDWGEVDAEDRAANDRALRDGERLLSVYRSVSGDTFWVITEADRSVTTVLLPDDY